MTEEIAPSAEAGFRGSEGARSLVRAGLTRRDFLVGASVAVGGLAVASALGLADRALARTRLASADEDLDAFIRRQMRVAGLPSLSTQVVARQDVVRSKAYGWANIEEDLRATPDTVYILASISKTFVCGALMQLWEAGSVDLDADVNTYLPFEVHNPSHPNAKITPQMLLTHTSSIQDRWIWGTPNDPATYGWSHGDSPISLHDVLVAYLVPGGDLYKAEGNFATYRPGKAFRYSSLGVDLAAYVVEVVSGDPFGEYCMDNLFTPLGMSDTGYHLADITTPDLAMPYRYGSDHDVYKPYYQYGMPDYPCAMLRTSGKSLARWLRCFMGHGELEGVRILKRDTVEEIFRPRFDDPWGGQQALVWYYESAGGEIRLGHAGENYGVFAAMSFAPDRDVGVITLGNRYLGSSRSRNRWLEIQNRLFEQA